jgi:hypothetical protein
MDTKEKLTCNLVITKLFNKNLRKFMPINFNGDVTVNGNMEVYGDGSVRISDNQIILNIDELKDFISGTGISNKEIYIEATENIKTSTDKNLLEQSFMKLVEFGKMSGKAFWISGLSTIAQEAAKSLAQHIK